MPGKVHVVAHRKTDRKTGNRGKRSADQPNGGTVKVMALVPLVPRGRKRKREAPAGAQVQP